LTLAVDLKMDLSTRFAARHRTDLLWLVAGHRLPVDLEDAVTRLYALALSGIAFHEGDHRNYSVAYADGHTDAAVFSGRDQLHFVAFTLADEVRVRIERPEEAVDT